MKPEIKPREAPPKLRAKLWWRWAVDKIKTENKEKRKEDEIFRKGAMGQI